MNALLDADKTQTYNILVDICPEGGLTDDHCTFAGKKRETLAG